MTPAGLAFASAAELAAAIRARRLCATDVVRAALARAEKVQAACNCFITLCSERALADAAAADAAVARGADLGPLHGVPFHVKDLVNTAGVRTTFASAIHEHNVPKADSVSRRPPQAGRRHPDRQDHDARVRAHALHRSAAVRPHAQRLGRGPHQRRLLGRRRGRAGRRRVPDRGRHRCRRLHAHPAACNGVVGFKQSAGVVPHDMAPEAFANISSINPMARTVMDAALMLEAMAGQHPCDPYSYGVPAERLRRCRQPRGLALGHAHRLAAAGRPTPRSTARCSSLARRRAMALGRLGASVEPMDDDLEPVEPIWFAYSSALWNARFRHLLPQWRNRLSPTLVRQMELGGTSRAKPSAGRCSRAPSSTARCRAGSSASTSIPMPTLARTAIPIEERLFEPIEIEGRKTDTVRKAWYPYTHPFNLTGHPAITLPCGFHSDGLPMAIQLVGRRGEDARLLRAAALFEAARPWAAPAAADRRRGLTRTYVLTFATRMTAACVGRRARAVRPARRSREGATGRGCLLGNPRAAVTAPGDPRGPPRRAFRGLWGPLTVPGVAFRHPRSAIFDLGHALASRAAPSLEPRVRTLSH